MVFNLQQEKIVIFVQMSQVKIVNFVSLLPENIKFSHLKIVNSVDHQGKIGNFIDQVRIKSEFLDEARKNYKFYSSDMEKSQIP